jgi:hypothetical protein
VLDGSTRGVKPQLDHSHSDGMIRDLLCVRCNMLLGYSEESVELLQKLISYIQRHKENPSGKIAKCWVRSQPKGKTSCSNQLV